MSAVEGDGTRVDLVNVTLMLDGAETDARNVEEEFPGKLNRPTTSRIARVDGVVTGE